MVLVRLADVDEREHHENERLQQHDQDVEDRPDAERSGRCCVSS